MIETFDCRARIHRQRLPSKILNPPCVPAVSLLLACAESPESAPGIRAAAPENYELQNFRSAFNNRRTGPFPRAFAPRRKLAAMARTFFQRVHHGERASGHLLEN